MEKDLINTVPSLRMCNWKESIMQMSPRELREHVISLEERIHRLENKEQE